MSEQIISLWFIPSDLGQTLIHVKPHGALYNEIAHNEQIAQVIVDVVHSIGPELVLYGLANSLMATVVQQAGFVFRHEAFVDRHYDCDGALLSPIHPNASINDNDVDLIASRTEQIEKTQTVESWYGTIIQVNADTYCVHSGHPQALLIVRSLHYTLSDNKLCPCTFIVNTEEMRRLLYVLVAISINQP